MKTFFAGLFVSFALLTPAFVQAQQPTQPTPEEIERAKSYFETAQLEYNDGNYPAALEQYTKAYNIVKKPTILFNIGQCHRKLGNTQDAADSYKQFLKDDPETQYRGEVEFKIAELEEQLKHKQSALDYYNAYLMHKLDTDPNEVAAKGRIDILQKDLGISTTPIGPTTGPDVTSPTTGGFKKFILPSVAGVVGIGSVIAAVGFHQASIAEDEKLRQACKASGFARELCEDVTPEGVRTDLRKTPRHLTVGYAASAGVAVILLGASAGLFAKSLKKDKEPTKEISIQVVPTTTGGLVTFTFVPKP